MPVKRLRRLQIGRETTPGVKVAANRIWRGEVETIKDAREWEFVEEDVGLLGGSSRRVMGYAIGELQIAETACNPEQTQYLISGLFNGPITGSPDGTGSSGFAYVTPIPTTGFATPTRTYTVETGDDFEAENAGFGTVTEVVYKGQTRKAIMHSGKITTQSVSRMASGFTAGALLPVVNDLMFAGSGVYIDLVGGTIGTTQILNQFFGFELTLAVMTNFKQFGNRDGVGVTPTFSAPVKTDYEITLKMTFEHDTIVSGTAGNLKAAFRNGTGVLVRLDMLGTAYTTAGTGSVFSGRRGVRFDLPWTVDDLSPLEEDEGNNLVTLEGKCRNIPSFGSGTITVANELSALFA